MIRCINIFLAILAKNLKNGFLAGDNLVASHEWIRDVFQNIAKSFLIVIEQIFIDFTSNKI